MPIKSTLYVSITSGVIGADSVATQELTGRRFSTDPRVPADAIVSVLSGGAVDYFGADSPEARFAAQYFSYVSPAPVSKAKNLQFAAYAPTGRTPALFGAPITASLADFQSVADGSMTIQLGDDEAQITAVNLSTATSFADVASIIQAALRLEAGPQYASCLVEYEPTAKEFSITGTSVGAASASYSPVTVGSDVGALIGLGGVGYVASPGVAPQSPLEAFVAAEQITDSFGSATFSDLAMTLEQAKDLATYVKGENVKYQLYLSVTRANYQAWYDELSAIGSTGLILNATANEYKESLPMAIMAATDYQRRNATINYMYRQSALSFDVTDTAEAITLASRRVNFYGNTAVAGQQIRFFQRGFLLGNASDALDMNVHANEQWFKAYMAAQLLSLQISTNKIGADTEGRGKLLAVLFGGIELAKFNGTISVGKELTVNQKLALSDLTGDPEAWHDVQTNGFWADVAIVPQVVAGGATEYVAKYTIAYSKNDVVRSIEGSHNLV